ncbi:hypothetical protein E2C01_079885 [Portunus trituberculatus]|uniref:Uncharacterized protein n=1 Tax=Portunus trituberculatus TaxID=210409 RepID=A0A5B7IU03_PORTR|nr:hypothetical protein [Portunus trituberculatus]
MLAPLNNRSGFAAFCVCTGRKIPRCEERRGHGDKELRGPPIPPTQRSSRPPCSPRPPHPSQQSLPSASIPKPILSYLSLCLPPVTVSPCPASLHPASPRSTTAPPHSPSY